MLYKYGKRTRDFFGRFYRSFSPVFYILGAFLIKQLLHTHTYFIYIHTLLPLPQRGFSEAIQLR